MEILNHFEQIDESTEENVTNEENVGVVLEEAEIVDCDAEIDGISEEDNIQYQLCEVNRNDNSVSYRVVQLQNDANVNDASELSLTNVNNTVQVLTSPINGQFYVLSNGNDVIASENRSVSPRVAKLQIETSQNIVTGIKKRDERRRVTHNEVERRRRDKINNWISKLGKLLPDCEPNSNNTEDAKSNFESQSKGGILARACEYITELREIQENFTQSLDENAQLLEEARTLRQVVAQLRKENSQLKAQITKDTSYILGI